MCNKLANLIIGHILLVIGIWDLSVGLIRMSDFSRVVLKHPIFWGLLLIFIGICIIHCGKCECKCDTKKKK